MLFRSGALQVERYSCFFFSFLWRGWCLHVSGLYVRLFSLVSIYVRILRAVCRLWCSFCSFMCYLNLPNAISIYTGAVRCVLCFCAYERHYRRCILWLLVHIRLGWCILHTVLRTIHIRTVWCSSVVFVIACCRPALFGSRILVVRCDLRDSDAG